MSFEEFQQKIASLAHPEGKIEMALELMRALLSDPAHLRMQEFWEVKNLCAEIFKEALNPLKRRPLWASYLELTEEANQFKLILDEKADFAIEQIDLALQLIEQDLKDNKLYSIELIFPQEFSTEAPCRTLQGEITFLNTLGCRLNALRTESIETEMRFKHRNRLLKQISHLGDVVFPRKKTLIKELSDLFLQGVVAFVDKEILLKNDIVLCQTLQKELTINPSTFKQVRQILSEAWNRERKPKVAVAPLPVVKKIECDLTQDVEKLLQRAKSGEEVGTELKDLKGLIKKRLEQYRREIGGSNLDFEKAINMQLLTESARNNLQRIEGCL